MIAIQRAVFCFAIASLVLTGVLADTTAAQKEGLPPHRAYAVRSEKLSIINEDTFEALGTLALPEGKTVFWWNNAEKDRLALIIQDGLIGNKPVTLVVIDLETDKIVNTVKLGYEAIRFITSGDGNRGYIILGGKIWRGTPSVVVVDTKSGTIVAKTDIKKEPTDFLLNDSGDALVFVRKGLNALKANQRIAASIELFDADTLERGKKFDLPGPIKGIYLDYPGRVYFLNPGVDHKSDKSRAQGELYVVDRETLELTATLEVGMAPGQLAWDAERKMFYLLTSPWATQKQAAAQLHLIGADGIAASIDLPRRPLGAQPSLDRKHFYVLYEDDVVRVDRDLEKAEKTLSLKDSPVQLFEHPDSGHFYALHFDSAYVSVVDGASGKTVDRVKSGRDSKRVTKLAAAAGAQVVATGLVVATGPSYTVNGTSYYNVPIVNPLGFGSENQTTFGNFSETADFLYVYNSWTDDVTVIDTVSHKIVKKVPGGEDGLMTVDDGKLLCTISPGYVRLFDIGNGFEMKANYDGIFSEVLEIPGKSKLYLSQKLGRAVAVVDLDTLGESVTIPGTSGKVIRPVEYE
jgi:DNA-binding beta-propeller fold protein YncE